MSSPFRIVAVLVLTVLACVPPDPDASLPLHQTYEILPWGPDTTQPGASQDPWQASTSLRIDLVFYEDPQGRDRWGSGRTLPPGFETFEGRSRTTVPAAAPHRYTFAQFTIPPPAAGTTSVYVQAEVTGFSGPDPIARARCPLEKVDFRGASEEVTKVVCRPFFGLIGRWNTLEPLTAATGGAGHNRWQFGLASFGDGRVVVGGGRRYDEGGAVVTDDTIEVFAPPTTDGDATGHWQVMANRLTQARYDLTATALGLAPLVSFVGGKTSETAYSDVIDSFDVETLSLRAGSIQALSSKRGEHGAALLGAGSVLFAGGYSGVTQANTSVSAGGDSIGTTAPLRYPCVVQVRTNLVLICGGDVATEAGKKCLVSDGVGVVEAGEMSVPRGDVKCAAVGGKVVLVGGRAEDASGKQIETWSEGGSPAALGADLDTSLTRHAVAAANGKLLVSGGYVGSSDQPVASGYLIDPISSLVTPLRGLDKKMASARAWHQMAGFPDGTVMVVGGKPNVATDKVGVELFVVPD